MKVYCIHRIILSQLLKPRQPQQRNYFLLNLFMSPANSDKSDKKYSPDKINLLYGIIKRCKI